MTRIEELLAEYGGDVDGVTKRFLGDDALYTECLVDFVSDAHFDELAAALETEDYRHAFECAHSLKGVSANLGLTPFHKAVATLVQLIKEERYDGVNDAYLGVVAARKELPVPEPGV